MTIPQTSHLLSLARDIHQLTANLVEELYSQQPKEPDFTPTSAEVPTSPAYNAIRSQLNDVATDLLHLINGPKLHLQRYIFSHNDLAAYQVAFEFNIFSAVPEGDSIGVRSLATKTGLDSDILQRVMTFLSTQRVFAEVEDDVFAHTHISATFARNPDLRAAAGSQLDEIFKAAPETATSLKQHPESNGELSLRTPFEERFGTPVFEYYKQHPKEAARFAAGMGAVTKLDRLVDEFRKAYPWHKLESRALVDVGGGSGHITLALARAVPSLHVSVQDISPSMIGKAQQQDLSDLTGRVSFMQHDFFNPQPVHNAGGFFLRHILHNWDDENCVRILRNLIPAMENSGRGTPVLISETIIPGRSTVPRFEEHGLRQMDIMMFVALGAKQRSIKQFEGILRTADPRLEIVNVYVQGTIGLLEVQLQRET